MGYAELADKKDTGLRFFRGELQAAPVGSLATLGGAQKRDVKESGLHRF